jgi:hypothetical protein
LVSAGGFANFEFSHLVIFHTRQEYQISRYGWFRSLLYPEQKSDTFTSGQLLLLEVGRPDMMVTRFLSTAT